MRVAPITFRAASDYINRLHRHHRSTTGCKFCISVVDDDGQIHGVAVCGRPVSRRLDDGFTLEINRVCSDGTRNVCSMLYGACCRIAKEMGYRKVITYTLASENGASLKASNFLCEGMAGGTHWTGCRNRGQDIPAEMKNRWVRIIDKEKIWVNLNCTVRKPAMSPTPRLICATIRRSTNTIGRRPSVTMTRESWQSVRQRRRVGDETE